MSKMNVVYTVGYSGINSRQLLRCAEELGAVVADIRFSPQARNPEFRKLALEDVLGDRYVYIKALGNVNYKNGGPVKFADEAIGLAQVEAILSVGAVILLCGCWDVTTCHRRVAAEALEERGYPVIHLVRQGAALVESAPAQPRLL